MSQRLGGGCAWTASMNHRWLLLLALAPLLVMGRKGMAQNVTPPAETAPAYVVGYIDVSPSAVRAMGDTLRAYVKASRQEPGAEDVRVLEEISRPSRFLILERWTDAGRQVAHDKGEARRRLLGAVAANAIAPADLRSHHAFLGEPLASPRNGAVYVITHLDVAPPAFAALQESLRPYFDDARSRPGAEGYQLLQHVAPRQNHLTALEIWRDPAAFEAHRASASARRFREAITPILGALYDERLYRELE
jgi:quinol monooxygenase YgiN